MSYINTIQAVPPKTAMQLVERARNGEGVPVGDIAIEFPQGNNVVCVMYPNDVNPSAHVSKNPVRAEELRRIIMERSK